ncbi:nectin-4 isoform X2 [Thalassophryne amazonica]|uniref:nectin-4 isoform X2 n=1 Tax=Thalassophryne amazonica TaxID=390379 RepID=UPI001470F74B|nr:nectin-4 isoform X2 [Thalassophryne amazonica]
MTAPPNRLPLCLRLTWIFVTLVQGHFKDLQDSSITSLAEEETILPCFYQVDLSTGATLIQATWFKEKTNGEKEQMITAHFTEGQSVYGTWASRVRFKNSDPIVDSSLVIVNTQISDEGDYICRISTFPSGNFDKKLSLTVWTVPISSLDPVVMVEGQTYGQAASCRSIARPRPALSWDTELNGQSVNRTTDNGAVTTSYSLYPLRNMNGKKLNCLVWHPTSVGPRRLRNNLVVHYPPHAEVTGYNGKWYVGLENAALHCVSGGNPKPETFTWIRLGETLPEGMIPLLNGTLMFGRPLSSSDAGTYQCTAKNIVATAKAEAEVRVSETPVNLLENLLIFIVAAVAVGLLILMLVIVVIVTCHHKRKNKKLEKELTEKKDEISTLSRQASFRRMNSVSTDTKAATDENIPLRVEGTLRTSLSSLGGHCRDSRSTISGGRGGGGGNGGAFDYLGRPVLYNNSRRSRERPLDTDEENRLRVETYVRNSSISLQETRLHPPLLPSTFPMVQSTEVIRQLNGNAIVPADGGSRLESATKNRQHSPLSCSSYPPLTDEEDEEDEGVGGVMSPASQELPDDQDSETNSSQISEVHSANFHQTNSMIRPKLLPKPNVVGPHASLIHKAQIV